MMLSDPACFVLVLLKCRFTLYNIVHKDKENDDMKIDHLGRPGKNPLPSPLGLYGHRLAV